MSGQEALNSSVAGIAAESGRAIGTGSKKDGATEDGGITELYKVNQVYYRLPPTLSLVSKRTLLVNQSQRITYPNPYNDVITFIFNTGEFYCSMPTSYMYIEIGYNSPSFDAGNTNKPTVTGGGVAVPADSYAWAKALVSQGNIMSIFEEVNFLSASGTEVCREQNKGLESAVRFRYQHEQQYIDTIGQVQGAAYGPLAKNYDGTGPTFDVSIGGNSTLSSQELQPIGGWDTLVQPRSGKPSIQQFGTSIPNLNNTRIPSGKVYQSFCVPMDQVLGCFKPYMGTLMPAGFLAGGRLEMRLKDPKEAFQFVAGTLEQGTANVAGIPGTQSDIFNGYLANLIAANQTGLVINKIYMVLDVFQFQDNVLKRLNQISAGQDGLTMLFDTYDHTSTMANGAGTVEAQVQQARSRIVRSWCVCRDTANISNPYINSLSSEAIVQRVSTADVAPYTNVAAQVPIGTSNKSGINGGYTIMTYPNYNGVTLASGANWNPLSTLGTTDQNVFPWTYPFIVKPRLPNTPYTFPNLIVTNYQAQLGALFFPQQPLASAREYYQNAMYLWGKGIPDKCELCSVSLEDFIGGTGWYLYDPWVILNGTTNRVFTDLTQSTTPNNPTGNSYYGNYVQPWGIGIFGMLAEKSQALQLSGLPISNARLMRHKFTFAYPPMSNSSRTISVITDYTRVAKVFLGGRIVVRE